jgi:hypothetical protein
MTSTQFMSAPGGYSATLANKLDKVDCSQVLSAVLKADRQLLGHIKMGKAGENIEVNWIEDILNAEYIVGSMSTSTAVTLSGQSVATLNRLVRSNTILQPAGTSLLLRVTATIAATNTFTVAKYASTVWAAVANTKMYIVAQPYADIATASVDISVARTKRKNFMQIFERAIEITQTRKNMSMEAVINELQLQIKRRTMEIKRELDISIVRGMAYMSTNAASGDLELRTMAGIIQLIRDTDLDTTNEDATVINASSSALTQTRINSLAYLVWGQGGLDETSDPILVVGAKQARVIAGFESELRRVEQGERQVGYYRNLFLTDMGTEIPIVMDRWIPDDKLILLDRSRASIRPMKGDNWHIEKMAKTGRNEKWQLSGQFTLDLRNADACHGMIMGLS